MIQVFLVLVVVYGSYKLQKSNVKDVTSKKKHEIMMAEERNKQVYYFRERMHREFGSVISNCMASYHDMYASNLPLTARNWIEVDKLTSINETGVKNDCALGINIPESIYFTRCN